MGYKMAICDDSQIDRQYVMNMVQKWSSSNSHLVHIDSYSSAESFLFNYEQNKDYDILLLDIEMGAMDGVSMAKQLRKDNDSGGEMLRIPIYQIRYVDVHGNYITIHSTSDSTFKMSLHELEKDLDERFYRAGRSVIINITYINRVTRSEIKLKDGTTIALPRGAYEGINRAIINME